MATSTVTLDMSTAQPIQAPVKLDMSTAQPIHGVEQPKPAAPQQDFSSRIGERIKQNVMAPAHLLNQLPDMVKSVLNHEGNATAAGHNPLVGAALVTKKAYGDLFNEYLSDPAKLVGDIITVGATHGIGEADEAAPKTATSNTSTPVDLSHPLAKEGLRLISPKAPNVIDAIRDGKWGAAATEIMPERAKALGRIVQYLTTSPDKAPAPAPAAPPSVPENWGKGVHGTPIDQWGKQIAPTAQAAPASAPASVPGRTWPPEITPEIKFENQLGRRGYKESLDDQGVAQEMQQDMDSTSRRLHREYINRMDPSVNKGEMLRRAGAGQSVKLTTTPPVAPVTGNGALDDLTKILQDSVDWVKKQKAGASQ